MKKGMMVMTIVVVLSFLVSISAVSLSFAKQASQTTPTSKQAPQQGPAQAPQTQTIKPPAAPTKTYVAKEKFWALEVDRCVLNGFNVCGHHMPNYLNLKLGPLTGKCYYKVKTIPLKDITEVDAKFWGTGKAYVISATLHAGVPYNDKISIEDARMTPQFTWAQVQMWKKGGQDNAPKIWTEKLDFTWNVTTATFGYAFFDFWVDTNHNIQKEVGRCEGDIRFSLN